MTKHLLALLLVFTALPARADVRSFEPGSLIIPMDTTYQDLGMFKAFGLVYTLLRAEIPVSWVIAPRKSLPDPDFVASALDHKTGAAVIDHGYRGGPFVIAKADADRALLVIDMWQQRHVTTVHVATTAFDGFVSKQLVAAPTIAVFSDGNEDIAFGYLNAAGIPDSLGQPWPDKKAADYPNHPDALTVAEVAGPTTTDHDDGALFDDAGNPVYCQIMTMHWGVNDVVDEVVAELRAFLEHPTHLFAECQAVNALENNVHGKFLTTNGFLIAPKPTALTFQNSDYPFAQMDGPFGIVGGSEPAYSLPPGDTYKDQDVVMITGAGSPTGVQDVWMTGYLDGRCYIDTAYGTRVCPQGIGKVSYLGGHRYETKVPISRNPASQGTRIFLNSLFEADCATAEGQPFVTFTKTGPSEVSSATAIYELTVDNFGPAPILDVVIADLVPAGATVVGGTEPYGVVAGEVRWSLGNLGAGESASVLLELELSAGGTYINEAELSYRVGVTHQALEARPVTTWFGGDADHDGCVDTLEEAQGTSTATGDTDEDGFGDCEDTCPTLPNPAQDLATDPDHCGACGAGCVLANAEAACEGGQCVIGACAEGYTDADHAADNGCERPCTASGDDDTCNGIDEDCDGVEDDGWRAAACGVGACASFSACVGGVLVPCVATDPGPESLAFGGSCDNGRDDDCDGVADQADPSCGEALCEGSAACADGDPCTDERCEAGRCVYVPACGEDVGGDADVAEGDAAVGDAGDAGPEDDAHTGDASGEDTTTPDGDDAGDTTTTDDTTATHDTTNDTTTSNDTTATHDTGDGASSDLGPIGGDSTQPIKRSGDSDGCASGREGLGLLGLALVWLLTRRARRAV